MTDLPLSEERPLHPGRHALTRILLTRHGESEHNLHTEVFMGRAPASRLTGRGREQARRLAARLAASARPQRIVCSSLPRTVETAEILAEKVGLGAPEREDAFWELSKGDWEGRMPRRLPPEVQRRVEADPFGFRHPGGESYADVCRRAVPAFERWVAAGRGATVLFVLHGDVMRALLYHLIGFPPGRIADWALEPCGLSEVVAEAGRRVIARLNDTAHLG